MEVDLSSNELAVIRAALRYWRDEMLSAEPATQKHYFDASPVPMLGKAELESVIARLQSPSK
ncbi:hypothetical protein ACMFWY_02480 [Roseiconus sp. JC912]|uniref:hypothetical protein n=1 Tax=Roseiconus sp. JC912 TaxID=3396307 RepID=UPI003A4C8060